jgi:hypothetical protein
MLRSVSFLVALLTVAPAAAAQEGYEYEIYSTHILAPRETELELNTNFVQSGRREIDEGRFPSHRALRSTLEVSRGLNSWLEAGVYFVGAILNDEGAEYVGNRARLTAVAPSRWNLPFELGVTNEVGYARPGFSESRWRYELSPIIGKSFGQVSLVLNPALERAFGEGAEDEIELEPRGRLRYTFGDEAAVSLEYYGGLGPATEFEPAHEQHHQLFITVQTELAHQWEIGFGLGRGLTRESDRTVVAAKLEYRFGK